MNNTADTLKTQIVDLVREYYKVAFPKHKFRPGESAIPYAGRVFEDDELVNLVEAGLDFWLTTGRFAGQFEREFPQFFGVNHCILDASPFIETNVKGTQVLLEGAKKHGIQRFIQVSTDEVYGSIDSSRFTEQSPLSPNSPYSARKATTDLLWCAYFKTHRLPAIVTRCTNNFGPYQFPEKLIPLAITNALENKPVPVYGDGLNIRDWIFVSDHCQALDAVIKKGQLGEIYNIGSGNEKTNLELISKLLELLDKPQSLIQFVTDRPVHDRRYALDCTRIATELGWKPAYSFEKALSATIDLYIKNESWWRSIKSGEYSRYYKKNVPQKVKAAVTGANGQLGTDLGRALHNFDVIPFTHVDIEIADMASVREAMLKHKPAIIINTAAYVRVDDCEDEKDKAFQVNALGDRNVAVVAQEIGAKLIYISTDYVFGGEDEPHTIPYTGFDVPAPLNTYGKSMLAGENFVRHLCHRHFIVRTSGLFGVAGSSGKGGNFVETVLKLARERDELRVVNDQILSPTYTKDLAQKITQFISTEYYGVFHITDKGYCSWYQFAGEILKQAGLKTPVIPVSSDEYPRKARRPRYSVLDNYHLRLLGMDDMRTWQEALKDYMIEKGHT